METVLSVIGTLENTTITKEQLEATRLAKYINQLRKRTNSSQLAKRAKSLLKRWREMVGMQSNPPQSQQQQLTPQKKIDEKNCNTPVSESSRTDISNDTRKSDTQLSSVVGIKKRKLMDDGMHKRKEKPEKTKHPAATPTLIGCCDDNHSNTVHSINDSNAMDVDIGVVDNNTQTLLLEQKIKKQNPLPLSNSQSSLLSVQQQQINYCSQRQQQGQTSFANLLNDLNNSSSNSSKLPTNNNNRRLSSSQSNVETLIIDQSSNSTPSDTLNRTALASGSASAAIMNNHINSASQCVVIDLQDTNSASFDLTVNNDEKSMNKSTSKKSKSNQMLSFNTDNFKSNSDVANKSNYNGNFSCVNNSSKNTKKSKREMKRKDRDKNAKSVQLMQTDGFNNNKTSKLTTSPLLSNTDKENPINYGNNYTDDNTPIIVDNNVPGMSFVFIHLFFRNILLILHLFF